ncbi:hypothetical protein LR48_Vigan08g127900 [Vigna angularis]|uniref:Uncharacterized protein n=1 Tax=Phaseolus angularis TaxID=3914 RepID=A0A0L9V6A3_PHAAN|nr:hypothetical protein LR48_Vigan08g127900 [Vigna angularis]
MPSYIGGSESDGHSTYDKAAQYFNIKLWRVPVDKNFQADVKAIRRHINKNTILERSFGICFHVDLCIGGFVLPFARELGDRGDVHGPVSFIWIRTPSDSVTDLVKERKKDLGG